MWGDHASYFKLGLQAAALLLAIKQQPANRTHNLQLHITPTT